MKKQKENSLGKITWSEMGKQNVQAKEVNCPDMCEDHLSPSHIPFTKSNKLRGCLHDTGATFALARVHSGSLP